MNRIEGEIMSEAEENDIKSKVLYSLHQASQKVACHRKKLNNISDRLAAAAKALHDPHMRIVNVDNKDLLTSGNDHIDYRSRSETVAAFNEYLEVCRKRDSVQAEWDKLNGRTVF